jgi:hypothetical protein
MDLYESGLDLRNHDQYEDKEQRQNTDVHCAGKAAPQHAFRGLGQFLGHQETDQQHDSHQSQRWAIGLCGDGGYGCRDGRYHLTFPALSRGKKIAIRWQFK